MFAISTFLPSSILPHNTTPSFRVKLGGVVETLLLERLKQPHSSKLSIYAPAVYLAAQLTDVQITTRHSKRTLRLPPTTDFQMSMRYS